MKPIKSELKTTTGASERDLALAVAEHLQLLRDDNWRIFTPERELVARNVIELYDNLSTLLWVEREFVGNEVQGHIHWTRINGTPKLVEMARRRGVN